MSSEVKTGFWRMAATEHVPGVEGPGDGLQAGLHTRALLKHGGSHLVLAVGLEDELLELGLETGASGIIDDGLGPPGPCGGGA